MDPQHRMLLEEAFKALVSSSLPRQQKLGDPHTGITFSPTFYCQSYSTTTHKISQSLNDFLLCRCVCGMHVPRIYRGLGSSWCQTFHSHAHRQLVKFYGGKGVLHFWVLWTLHFNRHCMLVIFSGSTFRGKGITSKGGAEGRRCWN